jgi:hypothetical protein
VGAFDSTLHPADVPTKRETAKAANTQVLDRAGNFPIKFPTPIKKNPIEAFNAVLLE